MLPSLTERDIEAGLRSFIEREFPIATPAFQPDGVSIVDSYIEKKGNFIQGPWLEIRRPFRTIPADMKAALPYLSGQWGTADRDWEHCHAASIRPCATAFAGESTRPFPGLC